MIIKTNNINTYTGCSVYGDTLSMPWVYGSVGQPKARSLAYKSEVPGSTPVSSCFSLLFIKNLINDKSNHKKKNVTICIVLSGAPHSYL